MEPDLRDKLLDSGEIELYIDEDKLENMVSYKVWNLLILKLTISQLVFIIFETNKQTWQLAQVLLQQSNSN